MTKTAPWRVRAAERVIVAALGLMMGGAFLAAPKLLAWWLRFCS